MYHSAGILIADSVIMGEMYRASRIGEGGRRQKLSPYLLWFLPGVGMREYRGKKVVERLRPLVAEGLERDTISSI